MSIAISLFLNKFSQSVKKHALIEHQHWSNMDWTMDQDASGINCRCDYLITYLESEPDGER